MALSKLNKFIRQIRVKSKSAWKTFSTLETKQSKNTGARLAESMKCEADREY